MKLIFTLLLIFLTIQLFAPEAKNIFIEKSDKIKYDPILFAFEKVESNFNTSIINRLGYSGLLQIGPEMIKDVNRICRKQRIIQSFTLTDTLDSTKSVSIWYIIQNYYNRSYSVKIACKVWNPTASKKYYQKIKKEL